MGVFCGCFSVFFVLGYLCVFFFGGGVCRFRIGCLIVVVCWIIFLVYFGF